LAEFVKKLYKSKKHTTFVSHQYTRPLREWTDAEQYCR